MLKFGESGQKVKKRFFNYSCNFYVEIISKQKVETQIIQLKIKFIPWLYNCTLCKIENKKKIILKTFSPSMCLLQFQEGAEVNVCPRCPLKYKP